MSKNLLVRFVHVCLILVFTSTACSVGTMAEPTATPEPTTTNTALPTLTSTSPPTNTPRPTSTSRPTETPDVAATQRIDEFQILLQSFEEEGYIETTEGEILEMPSFEEEWAQIGWYRWWPYDEVDSNFVFKAHFKWSSARDTSDDSGCGFIFGIQENDDHYVVFLAPSRILFLLKRGSGIYQVGKTRGSGRVNFGNPAEADFAVAVKDQNAYVSVNGEVTEYTLSVDQTSRGTYGVTLLSGINSDYGTRCEMTDVLFWTQE